MANNAEERFGAPTLTPYATALCVLIKGYLNPGEFDPACSWQLRQLYGSSLLKIIRTSDQVAEPSVVGLLQILQVCMRQLQLIGSSNGSNLTLANEVTVYIQELTASLQHQLGLISQSPEGLAALFDNIACMVTTSINMRAEESIGADDNSVMGFFLRRCWVDFAMKSFAEQCELMESIRIHTAKVDDSAGIRPRPALEEFLANQLADMQISVGTKPREILEKPLSNLSKHAPRLPDVEFLSHESALLHSDVSAAVDRSHAYYNRENPRLTHIGVVASGEQAPVVKERQRLQSAALQLAVTHARLGQVIAALRALSEAMRTAQQANDDASLAHALAVLCQVTEMATPGSIDVPGPEQGSSAAGKHQTHLYKLLLRLFDRGQELALPHLIAYSRLSLAKFRLMHPLKQQPWHANNQTDGSVSEGGGGGAGTAPGTNSGLNVSLLEDSAKQLSEDTTVSWSTLEIARSVRYVSQLEYLTSLAAAVPVPPPTSSGMAAVRVVKGVADMFVPTQETFHASLLGSQGSCAAEVRQLAGTSSLLRAANWTVAGNQRLSDAHSLAFIASRTSTAKSEDVITALVQLATSLAAAHGPKAAEAVLDIADQRYPTTESKVLMATRLVIAHERAIRRLELEHAAALSSRLTALAAPDDDVDIAMRLEAEERVVITLLAGRQFPKAEKAAQKLFELAHETGQQRHALRLLLLLARIHIAAGSATTALPYVLSCMQQCKELEAEDISLEATVLMSEVWFKLGPQHTQRAQRQLDNVLGLVLAHGSLDLKAKAQKLLAEIIMASHASAATLAFDRDAILSLLEEASARFTALEDWQQAADVYHLQAVLYHGLGDVKKRDSAAAVFNKLQREEDIAAAMPG